MQSTPANSVLPKDLASWLQEGFSVLLIDVRTPAEYRELHADGAELHPLEMLDPASVQRRMAEISAQTVCVFCRSGARAAQGASTLRAAGLQHVFAVEGGTLAWDAAGLPVIRGASTVLPMERQVLVAAGSLVLLGFFLGWFVSPTFFGLSALVGCGLIFSGLTGICGMAMLLAKMPWNK
jgi:rhodanese-related sulfurtransferase